MAQVLVGDTIDFSAYMEESDPAHSVRSASAYEDEVIAYFHSEEPIKGAYMPWLKTQGDIRFRTGEVSLWNGFNGSGKSMVLGQVCMGFVNQEERVCIASMEMKPHMTLARINRQAYGQVKPTEAFIREFMRKQNKWLWLYDQQGTIKPQKVLAVARYCADQLKIKHFVIDSLMKCGIGEDDYNAQKAFVDQITAVARDLHIHIHLVTHARKGASEMDVPGKMDVKGSGSITDQVDNVITVWRNKKKERAMEDGTPGKSHEPDCLLICDKQRNGEWEGKIALWYHRESMSYRETGY